MTSDWFAPFLREVIHLTDSTNGIVLVGPVVDMTYKVLALMEVMKQWKGRGIQTIKKWTSISDSNKYCKGSRIYWHDTVTCLGAKEILGLVVKKFPFKESLSKVKFEWWEGACC